MAIIMSFLKNLLTESDNQTFCLIRSAVFLAFIYFGYSSVTNIVYYSAHIGEWSDSFYKFMAGSLAIPAKSFTEKGQDNG